MTSKTVLSRTLSKRTRHNIVATLTGITLHPDDAKDIIEKVELCTWQSGNWKDDMTTELREAAVALAERRLLPGRTGHARRTLEQEAGYFVFVTILEEAMLLAANNTRELCCEFPNKEMTGATNNHEVRKRILLELKGEKV